VSYESARDIATVCVLKMLLNSNKPRESAYLLLLTVDVFAVRMREMFCLLTEGLMPDLDVPV